LKVFCHFQAPDSVQRRDSPTSLPDLLISIELQFRRPVLPAEPILAK
jgi:hypothetical protein